MTKKSGLADSPFFTPLQPKVEAPVPPPPLELEKVDTPLPESPISEKQASTEAPKKIVSARKTKLVKINNHDTVIPRHHDTMTPSNQDTMQPEIHGVMIDPVRKAVKEVGKEAATHRFTITEKKELADLIYTYKNRGIKTTENEIARISVNFIIEDYRVNGENSVLHKLLKALRE